MINIKKHILTYSYFLIILLILNIVYFTPKLNNNTETTSSIISTSSAIVFNARTKEVLFEKNAHTKKLTASICKVVTALTALENLNKSNYIIISDKMVQVEGSRIYLEVGDIVSIETLLYGLLLRSGNDAAKAIALSYSSDEYDFIDKMNELVKRHNLQNTIFNNPTGLDEDTKNYSTCYDLAYLTSIALENETFKKIFGTKKYSVTLPNGKEMIFHNKHKLLISDDSVIGGKTGYTKKAGRTLITVFNKNNQLLVVVTMDAYDDWNLHKWLVEEYDE